MQTTKKFEDQLLVHGQPSRKKGHSLEPSGRKKRKRRIPGDLRPLLPERMRGRKRKDIYEVGTEGGDRLTEKKVTKNLKAAQAPNFRKDTTKRGPRRI